MYLVEFSKAVGVSKRCPECGMKMVRGKCAECGHESKESMKHEKMEKGLPSALRGGLSDAAKKNPYVRSKIGSHVAGRTASEAYSAGLQSTGDRLTRLGEKAKAKSYSKKKFKRKFGKIVGLD